MNDLIIEGVNKNYKQFKALSSINLTIKQGMFGLLGPNGAGKTTLLRILATLHTHQGGEIRFGNLIVPRDNEKIRAVLGYLPQEFGLYKKLNGREFLEHVAILKGISKKIDKRKAVDQVLEHVNLTKFQYNRIGTFSGGMKQRLGIAQALIGNPQILILDEPTTGLDPDERNKFRNLFTDLSKNRIVILSTHIVSDIENCCINIAVMKSGEIVFNGNLETLKKKAEGMIWEMEVGETELKELRKSYQIINSKRLEQGFQIKLLSRNKPTQAARCTSGALEDGYLVVTNFGI